MRSYKKDQDHLDDKQYKTRYCFQVSGHATATRSASRSGLRATSDPFFLVWSPSPRQSFSRSLKDAQIHYVPRCFILRWEALPSAALVYETGDVERFEA